MAFASCKPRSKCLLTALHRAASHLHQWISLSFAVIMLPKEFGQAVGEVAVSQPVIQLSTGRELHTPPSDLLCGRRSGPRLLN